jgi:hypothetical protein
LAQLEEYQQVLDREAAEAVDRSDA